MANEQKESERFDFAEAMDDSDEAIFAAQDADWAEWKKNNPPATEEGGGIHGLFYSEFKKRGM